MSGKPRLVLVVAVAENNVIGNNGALPWRLKSDMAYFRQVTMGKPIVMGRKTWDSLPKKPLPGRTNIVITRDKDFAAAGALVASSMEAALTAARGDALRRGVEDIAVIGGSDIFAMTLPHADQIEFTRVHLSPAGDVRFPQLDMHMWREAKRRDFPAGPGDEAAFTILTYERAKPGKHDYLTVFGALARFELSKKKRYRGLRPWRALNGAGVAPITAANDV